MVCQSLGGKWLNLYNTKLVTPFAILGFSNGGLPRGLSTLGLLPGKIFCCSSWKKEIFFLLFFLQKYLSNSFLKLGSGKNFSAMTQKLEITIKILGPKNKIYFSYKLEIVTCSFVLTSGWMRLLVQVLIFDYKPFFHGRKILNQRLICIFIKNVWFCFF